MRLDCVMTLCIVLSIVSGCDTKGEYRHLRHTLRQFEERPIVFPDKFLCVESGATSLRNLSSSLPAFIFYTGPDECNDCTLLHLNDKKDIFNWSEDSNRFLVYIILDPHPEEIHSLIETILDYRYPFPVYINIEGHLQGPDSIPADPRFHSFLIDCFQRPILVGNPLINPRVKSMFWSIIGNKSDFA